MKFQILIRLIIILSLGAFCLPSRMVAAQGSQSTGPVYIVQEGDNLWDIAYRFHVSQDALAAANGITNTDQISIGQQLLIPGLDGIQGVLTTDTVTYGETLQTLSQRYHLTPQMLKRLNRITSPGELYAGYSLIITQLESTTVPGVRVTLNPGQSMLELAILNNTDPWTIRANNDLQSTWAALPGEVLRTAKGDDEGPGALSPSIDEIILPKFTQGQTAEIDVIGESGITLSGKLGDRTLNFFPAGGNSYTALQGVHAMAETGLYDLAVDTISPGGSQSSFSQKVMVRAGDFLYDRSLPVDPATLDPETNRAENELWAESSAGVTAEKLWAGSFFIPVNPVFAECYSSRFGSRRSYNGGAYDYFHTGLDFCGQVGDPIYAAAPGVVVYAGLLTVRGNATMIDHGRGVFSAYMHQSEILVNIGDHVEEGQLIGRVGNTGRVEGPHLHFEVIVGGVQVDPLQWLSGEFP